MMDNQQANEVKDKLNKMQFEGFEGVLAGDVLHYPVLSAIENEEHSSKVKSWLRYIKLSLEIASATFVSKYDIKKSAGSETLFLFSSSYGNRHDHRRTFFRLVELFPQSSYYIYDGKTRKINIPNIKYLKLLKSWKHDINNEFGSINSNVKKSILLSLLTVYIDYHNAEMAFGEGFSAFNNLVSWCDIHAVDSFFTQKFNDSGKNSIDLMHGSIGVNNNAWSVLGVKSKVFIADSKHTEDILRENGYTGRVLICGYPNSISETEDIDAPGEKMTIGAVLSGAGLHQDNIDLCRALEAIRDMGYTLEAKLHPSENAGNYSDKELALLSRVFGTEISSGEFLKRLKFAVISPSTVVYEAIKQEVRFLLYADSMDLYTQFDMPTELIATRETLKDKVMASLQGEYDHIYRSLSEYYSVKGNVKINYLKAFNEMGIH